MFLSSPSCGGQDVQGPNICDADGCSLSVCESLGQSDNCPMDFNPERDGCVEVALGSCCRAYILKSWNKTKQNESNQSLCVFSFLILQFVFEWYSRIYQPCRGFIESIKTHYVQQVHLLQYSTDSVIYLLCSVQSTSSTIFNSYLTSTVLSVLHSIIYWRIHFTPLT